MAPIDLSLLDVGRLDRLAGGDSPVHRLDPRAKLLTTAAFVVCVVSFGKYEVSALLPFLLFPIAVASAAGLPFGYLLRKLLLVSPFAVLVGAANPFFDRETLVQLGPWAVSGGWVSFASILLRFTLTVGAALVLISTTSFHGVCLALNRVGVPRVMTVQLLLLYRYLFVLTDEAVRLVRARALRSFGRRGLGVRVFASLVGHLLLRTLARAQRIHRAMLSRGFDGEVRLMRPLEMGTRELVFVGGWCAAFLLFRWVNVARLLGAWIS
ncbi:MAG: cobalt ECF transporter T component CbiQ [Deferrisomatales bacterium]